jgi:hypothetical protein
MLFAVFFDSLIDTSKESDEITKLSRSVLPGKVKFICAGNECGPSLLFGICDVGSFVSTLFSKSLSEGQRKHCINPRIFDRVILAAKELIEVLTESSISL